MIIAHFAEDKREHSLEVHLKAVAQMAAEFAKDFDVTGAASLWAFTAGLLHDLGKVQEPMQLRLRSRGQGPKVEHSAGGAAFLFDVAGNNSLLCLLAYCIAGHHGGLPNGGSTLDQEGEAATLAIKYKREKKRDKYYQDFISCLAFPDWKSFPNPSIKLIHGKFSVAFFIRMIFSCLVDADFIDTEIFMSEGKVERPKFADLNTLNECLNTHITENFGQSVTLINLKRTEIRLDCERAAEYKSGLFSLTVPTGGGKTISSMVFALKHALVNGQKRIIYIIPYTSIIDQTVEVFSRIFGAANVLAHHSRVEYDDEDEMMNAKRLATENWDAPIIVTTNVQFFESLFSNRTSRCRKLHNIANSVLIFDEAQMLPQQFLRPSVAAIAELVVNYRCSAVLCTATQPSLGQFLPKGLEINEIVRNPSELYDFLKRVQYSWIGVQTDMELAQLIALRKQVLCIINTKAQARELYKLVNRNKDEGNYHLSTNMHAKHRKGVIATIRKRLKDDLPCRVISTSLIEAGVDLDFPHVMRQVNGLDTIIQAGGRCNREGKCSLEESYVLVFQSEDKYTSRMPSEAKLPGEIANEVIREGGDMASIESIGKYFDKLFDLKGMALDKLGIVEKLSDSANVKMSNADKTVFISFPFKEIADLFRIIDKDSISLIIPVDELANELVDLRKGYRSVKLLRKLALYSVDVRLYQFKQMVEMGAVEVLDKELCILSDLTNYNVNHGFEMPEAGQGIFDC